MAKLPQYEIDKRMRRSKRTFMRELMNKIQQNNSREILALSPKKLEERLMELAAELLNKNINKSKFWHLQDEARLIQAEKLVKSFVAFTDVKFKEFTKAIDDVEKYNENTIEAASTGANDDDYIYDAYIDLMRTLMLQDQEGPPGSENLMQDLFNQYEGPAVIRQGSCEVRITGAQFFPVPVNGRNFVNPNKRAIKRKSV